jgi:hypothetical protein
MRSIEAGQVYAIERDGLRHIVQALSPVPDGQHWRCDDGQTYATSALLPATDMERTRYISDKQLRDRLLEEAHRRRI